MLAGKEGTNMGQRYQHKQKRSSRVRLRTVLFRLLYVVIVLMVIYPVYYYFTDPYLGRTYTNELCQLYREGLISGTMCSSLCIDRSVRLSSFVKDLRGYRYFYSDNKILKVKISNLNAIPLGDALKDQFIEPTEGTEMVQFRSMVSVFIEQKLGIGDHKELLTYIIDVADINKDAKVSLAEAKTIWSLLQGNEFFTSLVFYQSEHVPNIEGFCGNVYAIEYINNNYLFAKPEGGVLDTIFPHRYTWGFPSWDHRAKIIVGLIELMFDLYQHGSSGTFYWCGLNELNIGYTDTYDAKIVDASSIISGQGLTNQLSQQTCNFDADCAYTDQCVTVCDKTERKCTGQLVRPNARELCVLMKTYVGFQVPRVLYGDLMVLIDKCEALDSRADDYELQHSLVLNHIKSLLWRQISDKV